MTASPQRIHVDVEAIDRESSCYVTTTGRLTGRPHTIEIWFTAVGRSLFLISGGGDRSDWLKNLLAGPAASVRVGKWGAGVQARVGLPS